MTARSRAFRAPLALGGGIALLALCSLALPFVPLYDPWAWLAWGGELAEFELDTTAGPSWKPLPVLLDAAFSLAGDAAPDLWLAVSRAGWIAAPLLAGALAARLLFPRTLASRIAEVWARDRVRRGKVFAAGLAGLGVILLNDPFTSWARQFAGGLSEPLLVAFVLGAIHLELSRRHGLAFALGVGAALLRPEAWPFLALYGWHLWNTERSARLSEYKRSARLLRFASGGGRVSREGGRVSREGGPVSREGYRVSFGQPVRRRWILAGAVAVPLLWLVPDLVGSGSPLTGASRAREGSGSPPIEAIEALGRSLDLVLASLWIGAAYAVHSARAAGERAIPLLAAGALAWIGLVALLAAVGYAGIPRFAAPAAAVGCVLGGVGIVRIFAALDGMRGSDRRRRAAIAAFAAMVVALAAQGVIRAGQIPGDLSAARDYARGADDLGALVERLGPERISTCGAVTTSTFLAQTQLAWELELPIDAIAIRTETAPAEGTAFLERGASVAARDAIEAVGRPLGSHGRWSAYAISCARASSAGERTIAGVAGARRYGASSTSSSSR